MNRIESIEQRLAEHKRLCEIPFFDATGEDDMYLRSYRKQLLEDIRPLLAVVKAAVPVLRMLEARDGVLCEPEDARFSLTRSEYGDIGLKEIEAFGAALADLEKPVDSTENERKV